MFLRRKAMTNIHRVLKRRDITLPTKIPWTEEPGRLQSLEWQRRRHDWWTSLHFPSHVFSSSCVWMWELDQKKGWALKPLNPGFGENSWESLGLQRDQTTQSYRKAVLNIHWKGWCWSWSSNNLATWCEEPTH